jgi:hypothetical protein
MEGASFKIKTPAPSGVGGLVRAVVSKRGVDDGNQKGGGSLQPAKESQYYYKSKILKRKKNFQKYFFMKKAQHLS